MTTPQNEYVKVGKEWPLWVSKGDVERATEAGEPVSVYPEHVDLTALNEARLSSVKGYVGVPLIGGQIDMDPNNNLSPYSWRGSFDEVGIVDQMVREDPVAQAIRLAWTLPLLSVQWSIQPGSEDPRDVEIAEFVQSVFFEHMRGGWNDFLEQAVQFTWRGFSAFEVVARYDKELQATVIDQLSPRLPWTVYHWQKYKDNRYGFTQWPDPSDPPKGTSPSAATGLFKGPVIPPDKLVLFRFQPSGDNPEPMGILRPCYGAWRQRRTYLKLEATGYERSAYGIPTVTVEPGANPGDVAQVNIILRELRAGIRSFAMFPKGFNLEWTECPMKADAIRHARVAAGQDMARAALCQFLFTGESAGAYSLIQGQLDHYTMALQQAANSIATTMSQGPHAIVKRLVNWNYPGVTNYPYVQAGEIRVGDPKQLVEAVKSAVDAGVVTPDALIESKIRDVLSLPQRVDSAAKPIDSDPALPGSSDLPEDDSPPDDSPPPKASSRGEEQAKREEEAVAAAEKKPDMSPPESVKKEMARGLEWHKEGHSGDGLKPETVAWARRMVGGAPISEDKVVKMRAWLARHAEDKKGEGFDRGEDGYPSPGRVAWALWGGDPAIGWSSRLVNRLRGEKETASETCCPVALSSGPIENRVENDIFIEGPGGRDVRPEERFVRFSEVSGVKDEANEKMADTITEWREKVSPMYAGMLAEKDTVEEMLQVEVPLQEELKGDLIDLLRDAYEKAKASAEREMARQKEDPSFRKEVEDGEAKPRMVDGQIELFEQVELADPVSAPAPAEGVASSPADEIDPEDTIRSTAAATTRLAADRVQGAGISSVQASGIGGAPPPPATVVASVVEALLGLSAGVDFREAQAATNTTYGLGRIQALRGADARRYVYSNLAESQSCPECLDHDGDEFGSDQLAEYSTPASWCEGLNMCNCLILGIL